MNKKIFTSLLVGILLVALMAGCSSGGDSGAGPSEDGINFWELAQDADATEFPEYTRESDERFVIGAVLPQLANTHFVGQAWGYFDEAERLGVDMILLDAGGYENVDVQLQQGEDLINTPVDALIVVAASGSATVPLVEQANAKGIPVINVNVMTESDQVVTRIRSEDYHIGEMQAEEMIKEMGTTGAVFVIAGPAGTSWANNRSQGFIDYMAENAPDVEILDTRFIDSTPENGLYETEDALTSYGDQITGIFTGADNFGVGAAQALEAAGRTDVVLTTTDSSPDGVAAIKRGLIDVAVVQSPVLMGQWGTRAAVMVLEGNGEQLYKNYWVPTFVVTPDNIEGIEFVGLSQAPQGWSVP